VRPQILAMYVSATAGGTAPMLPLREFPADPVARAATLAALRTEFAALAAAARIDLFNLLRFPKPNLRMAMLLVQAHLAKYFPAQSLPAVLADQGKATSLITQYKEGPSAAA
jgi:hypothetical protein